MFIVAAELEGRGKTRSYLTTLVLSGKREDAEEFDTYELAREHMQKIASFGPGFADKLFVLNENVEDVNTLSDDEMRWLTSSQSERDWNDACLCIKVSRGERYPSDWYERVIKPGLIQEVAARWGGTGEMKVVSL